MRLNFQHLRYVVKTMILMILEILTHKDLQANHISYSFYLEDNVNVYPKGPWPLHGVEIS